jgi:hypothetical protein
MMLMRVALVTAVIVVVWGTAAGAQDTAQAGRVILQRVNLGDRITVTLQDGAEMRGRLVDTKDGVTLRHETDQRTFPFSDIDTISRSRNGMILGPVIGTAAGFAVGLPLRSRMNNEARDGDKGLAVLVVTGVAIGTLLDALIGSEQTIYRRASSPATFSITPTAGGFTARWQKAW